MTQYELYRDLARPIYELALDASAARDHNKVAQVEIIERAAFKPLREELGGHTPIFEILENMDFKVHDDGYWKSNLETLRRIRTIYPEVLG